MKKTALTMRSDQFKVLCLQLMDEVNEKRISVTITKNGKPVAKLVPIEEKTQDSYGCLNGTMTIKGDIVAPIDVILKKKLVSAITSDRLHLIVYLLFSQTQTHADL